MQTRPDNSAHFELIPEKDVLVCRLSGSWEISPQTPVFPNKAFAENAGVSRLRFEDSGLDDWDNSLLSFIFQALCQARQEKMEVDCSPLPEGICQLLREAQKPMEEQFRQELDSRPSLVERLGMVAGAGLSRGWLALEFTGQITLGFGRLFIGRSRMRMGDLIGQWQEVGVYGLPIVGLISFLVGLVLAFQAATQLTKFGAELYVPLLVGLSIVREMGPMMAAVVLAGRTGAAFAAALASMKGSEEIDALRGFGISPFDFLVMPRILGLFLMMPFLALYANALGIAGGMTVGVLVLEMPPQVYLQETFREMGAWDLGTGLIKAVFFGLIIGFSGCLRGLQSEPHAEGVGKATTSAVVTSILLLIVADAIFAVIFSIFDI